MTTPGGQLTPGDEPEIGDPPQYGVPSGAYVGDAGSPQSFKDLNTLTKDKAKQRMQQPLEGMFGRQLNAVTIFANTLLGLVQGAVNLVVGTVQAVVDGIKGIIGAIGSLFGAAHRDTAAVDAARVAGELAIIDNMSSNLEYLDEIQRVGGAFMEETWTITFGEEFPHPLPMGSDTGPYYGAFPLAQGTLWHSRKTQWGSMSTSLSGSDGTRGDLAKRAGTLELLESGLWMIYFQAAILQGSTFSTLPADVWCYVSDNGDWVPTGAPRSGMEKYNRSTGAKSTSDNSGGYSSIHTFGRAGQYLGKRDSTQGGGNTISGYMMCYLDSPGWFVHMSTSGFQHFGGPASTFVFAQKVNSSTLRADIEQAKTDLANAGLGTPIAQQLDEAAIGAMVAEAGNLEVPDVVVPTDPPEAGNG